MGTTRVIFNTFDPMTFPTTISVFFFSTALIVAASSGKLVPIAIIVSPIISSEIFNNIAMFSAYMTAYLDPKTKEIRPTARRRSVILLPWLLSFSKSIISPLDLFLKITYKKYMKTNNNKTLSSREIWLSNKANPRTKADAKNGTNWINGVFFGLNDIPMQETPKIRAMLDIFDPTTAPIAMLSLWFNIDDMPTKISGADVPRATTVKPIVNSLIPSFLAIND